MCYEFSYLKKNQTNNCDLSIPIDFCLKAKLFKNVVWMHFHFHSDPVQPGGLPRLANIVPKPLMASLLVPVTCCHQPPTSSPMYLTKQISLPPSYVLSFVFQGGLLHLLLPHWLFLFICFADSALCPHLILFPKSRPYASAFCFC